MSELRELYKGFSQGLIWADMREYLQECLGLNRDLLEGFSDLEKTESDESLRGRCRQIRDLLSFVDRMANGD